MRAALRLLLPVVLLGGLPAPGLQPPAAAQTAATVPLWDPAYRDLDRLVGAGLVTEILVGQRPYSERRFADFAVEALEALGPPPGAREEPPGARARGAMRLVEDEVEGRTALREAARRLARRFPDRDDPDGFELSEALAEGVVQEARIRDTAFDTGRGLIEDRVNPLLGYRDGRRYVDGVTVGLEASARATVGRVFAFEARPRVVGTEGPTGRTVLEDVGLVEGRIETDVDVDVMRLYGRLVAGNFALEVGRDAVVWGQGRWGGSLLSRNPRGLDMIHISNDAPVRLPWIFGALGPSRFAFFGADLGGDQHFPHAKLFGGKWSARPHPRFEFGFSFLNKQGGEGAPDASFGERLRDILIFPDVFDTDADLVFSEKVIAGEVRWRVPAKVPVEVYGQAAFTDFDIARSDQTFWLEAAYQAGIHLPALGSDGRTWLRIEAEHTGATFYRHAQFLSGLTLDRMVLGSALGPDGEGVHVEVGRTTASGHEWAFAASAELRERDAYSIVPDTDLRAVKIADLPHEWRYRGVLSWLGRLGERSALQVEGGVEYVDGFAFIEGRTRTDAFGGVRWVVWP